jgi:hypothetical protein
MFAKVLAWLFPPASSDHIDLHGVRLGFLPASHLDECIDFVTKLFATKEALGQLLNLSEAELRPYMEIICRTCFAEDGIMSAIDLKTDRLIGFGIGKAYTSELVFPEELMRDHPGPMQIFEMLEELDRPFVEDFSHLHATTLHFFMMGMSFRHVAKEWGRFKRLSFQLGYMRHMMTLGRRMAKKRGFTHLVGETSGTGSQKYAKLFGGTPLHYIDYRKHFGLTDAHIDRVGLGDRCTLYFGPL